MDPVTTTLGILGSIASIGDGASKGGGVLSAPAAAGVATLDASGLTDQQFVDAVATIFAASNRPGPAVGSEWKANRKRLLSAEDLAYLQENGLIADPSSLTKGERQFVALFALVSSASSKPIATVVGQWKTYRGANHIGSQGNLDLFREWGLIG